MNWMKNKLYRLKRLYDYIKIINKTHDFDFSYCIEIFCFSLEKLANTIETGHGTNGKKHAKEIRNTIAALKRVESNYFEQTNVHKINTANTFIKAENGEHYMFRFNPKDKKILDDYPKKCEYLYKQDWDYIYKQFKTKSSKWWD